jgi:hypothetical protein
MPPCNVIIATARRSGHQDVADGETDYFFLSDSSNN